MIAMNLNKEILYSVILILIFLWIDLRSKKWASEKLIGTKKLFNGKIELFYIRNYGIAFNKLSGKKNLILVINMILFLYLLYLLFTDKNNYFSYSLILAGGIGNFLSRLKNGYVTDFIYFNIKKWPVFNIADFEVFIGVGILILKELIK